jgi:hypothetical protein
MHSAVSATITRLFGVKNKDSYRSFNYMIFKNHRVPSGAYKPVRYLCLLRFDEEMLYLLAERCSVCIGLVKARPERLSPFRLRRRGLPASSLVDGTLSLCLLGTSLF